MGDPKRDDEPFLDDIESLEAEAEAAEAAEDTAGAGRAAPAEGVESELDALRAERDELKDRFMRALADAENTRKRAEKDRREAERYGSTRLARDLLPVYDNLQRAISAAREESETASTALVEGVELTLKELLNVFHRHGVEVVSPQVGDKFDPSLHEAMFEAPVPGTTAGEIIQVSADGFLLHERLLRPAQVGVSSMKEG
jgi:molecular chaperone GrpE